MDLHAVFRMLTITRFKTAGTSSSREIALKARRREDQRLLRFADRRR
ncbi:hypothetical protein SAMN05421748_122149 [Paractinoplanes atraurantiacus]|uniref:Uncharacterized protein n=1 Tax=Paractinoplanes atraurantiacus TaxID=1036182 RepID=A0A285JMR0_9ACTN|nr:hypothetical protein SAMN05421748_122149 [Actinoplanes atraurantiacus]